MKLLHEYRPYSIFGGHIQFFERLIMLMAKNPNLPDKIITVKEVLEMVKELIGFFTRKIQIIQGKLKVLS